MKISTTIYYDFSFELPDDATLEDIHEAMLNEIDHLDRFNYTDLEWEADNDKWR